MLHAQVACALGRAALQRNEFAVARGYFDGALANLQHYDQSLLAGRVRFLMAQTLQPTDRAGAQAWALGALATFERIGAAREVDECWALLRTLEIPGGVRRHSITTSPLSAREGEIAVLVAQGLSNREIGERLFISAKTVEHHVGSILTKLNLRSRTEIATLAASGKLNLPHV
jgi:DNA-binding CsgD family transcriptional regulator